MPRLAALLIMSLAAPALAQEWDTRDGDARLTPGQADARLRGQLLTFFDDGQAHFYEDGRYTYAYDEGAGGYAYGWFDVAEGGVICIDYVNGSSRCDLYVESAGRLLMIDAEGNRFPVRSERDAGPDPPIE